MSTNPRRNKYLRVLPVMPRTGRCIIRPHNKYQTPNDDTSTARTLGLSLCCVLSMHEIASVAGNDACISPDFNSPLHSRSQSRIGADAHQAGKQTDRLSPTLREDEFISTFCNTYFNQIPQQDRPDWIQKVRSSFERLNFVSSAAFDQLDQLGSCLNEVELALLDANFEMKPGLTEAEAAAIRIVQDILGQLDNAITKSCPAALVTNFREGFTKVLNCCQISSEAPSYGTDKAWHKRAQPLLAQASSACRQSAVWDQLAEVLGEAESTLDTRSFSDDELNTFHRILELAVMCAPLYPCVAGCANIWYKLTESAQQPQGLLPSTSTRSFEEHSLLIPEAEGLEAPLDLKFERLQDYPQSNDPGHHLESYTHQQVLPPSGSLWQQLHQRRSQSPSGLPASNREQHKGQPQVTHHNLCAVNFPDLRLSNTKSKTHSSESQKRCTCMKIAESALLAAESKKALTLRDAEVTTAQIAGDVPGQSDNAATYEAPSDDTDGTWHNRVQLLARALLACRQKPAQSQPRPQVLSPGNGSSDDSVSHTDQQILYSDISWQPSYRRSVAFNSEIHQARPLVALHDTGVSTADEESLLGAELRMQLLGRSPQESVSHSPGDEAVGTRLAVGGIEDRHWSELQRPEEPPPVLEDVEQQVSQIVRFSNKSLVQASARASGQLVRLNQSLSELDQRPAVLDAQLLTSLDKIRSSLLDTRQEICDLSYCVSPSHMARLNEAIVRVSRLWHSARLAHSGIPFPFEADELISLAKVDDPVEPYPLSAFVASETYAALLGQDSKEILNGFFLFLDSTTDPIDVSTAKLCLLSLLYLRHEKVELFKPEAQDPLSRLISKLRHEIFKAKQTDVSILNLPEFNEFCLAYFGQRPISVTLKQYNDHFLHGLSQELASTRATHATQLDSLKAFRSHVLSSDLREGLFTDEETLAYVKQFANFAKKCLDECQVYGHPTRPEDLLILKLTLDGLMWFRLLLTNSGVTPPSFLKKTYDAIAEAWILKSLWNREGTASLLNSERAMISKRILTVLESGKHDKLLACSKAFLDRSVPLKFVESTIDETLWDRASSGYKQSDDDKMIMLLASECRLNLFEPDVAYQPTHNSNLVRRAVDDFFTTGFVQAQSVAKERHNLPTPNVSHALHSKLQEYFLAPSAPQTALEAARSLSPDFVLKEALKETNWDDLTVSDVGHCVATYLIGTSPQKRQYNSLDQQWLDFLTCQLKWCTLSLKECKQRDLMALVQSINTYLQAFWQNHKWNPIQTETTPYFIRHFVNMTALKWLSDSMEGDFMSRSRDQKFKYRGQQDQQVLKKMLGAHVFAWMPRWLASMHSRQVLFPSDIILEADLLCEKLCKDVSQHVEDVTVWATEPNGPLGPSEVRDRLRDLLKVSGAGSITKQHVEVLLGQHTSPMIPRWSRNFFLTFLLYVWHHKCLPVDMSVIEECIRITVNESLQYEEQNKGMSVSTMQRCLTKLLITWDDAQSPESSNAAQEIESEEGR
eukprot:Blabericola_migrator_1__11069@NODE_644_length_7099_cov_12_523606_g473_i0_p1_GENE_NODE_644_length_7099_cov_12_523606_g473_i0NODE_644_length_7099_cov_12_523606_g473_i0_p1_ORF_typecomplete_len1492_score250_31_NODE_644_length_7099_cov_12_523606_g473_i018926367